MDTSQHIFSATPVITQQDHNKVAMVTDMEDIHGNMDFYSQRLTWL